VVGLSRAQPAGAGVLAHRGDQLRQASVASSGSKRTRPSSLPLRTRIMRVGHEENPYD